METIIVTGDKFICINHVIMNGDGCVAYVKDRTYVSESDGCITDEQGSKMHWWADSNTFKIIPKFYAHFKEFAESEPVIDVQVEEKTVLEKIIDFFDRVVIKTEANINGLEVKLNDDKSIEIKQGVSRVLINKPTAIQLTKFLNQLSLEPATILYTEDEVKEIVKEWWYYYDTTRHPQYFDKWWQTSDLNKGKK